jgi:DNA polymerase-3 subunit epsilon
LIARQKFPGAQASLDALCRRFEIDNTGRVLHGALLDSELLAEVYLELIGGRQQGLELGNSSGGQNIDNASQASRFAALDNQNNRPVRAARPHQASIEELSAHEDFLKNLKNPIWMK